MLITLISGDHDWSIEGTHILDDNGFAMVLTEPKTIEVEEETGSRMMPIIEAARFSRGLNEDNSIPLNKEVQDAN